MITRAIILIFIICISSCALFADLDYVKVTPVKFVPVVGSGGPKCQGMCPSDIEDAEKIEVMAGRTAFCKIVEPAECYGNLKASSAFLEFAKKEVVNKGLCTNTKYAGENSEHPKIYTVEGNSVFWIFVICGNERVL
ncbi:hypothetical protein [Ferrimonas gelatinilytica]|uniref:Lipoprotein n=1 Tax=Ferrimonas gelatinilytica TaxID=1255257 RepID=A0ABP9SDV5_9GAMM